MFPMLVTVCVAGTASMFLHVNEPTGVNPIAEFGPTCKPTTACVS